MTEGGKTLTRLEIVKALNICKKDQCLPWCPLWNFPKNIEYKSCQTHLLGLACAAISNDLANDFIHHNEEVNVDDA